MKKLQMLFAAALCLFSQAVWAAPVGWYEFDATWRDGSFTGQFYYDEGSPFRVTAVDGTLVDLAQTTAINKVVNPEDAQLERWVFLANANPAELAGHDAGFYLTLVDLGASLTLDLSGVNGLFDWSREAFYNPGQLDDSPLLSFRIEQANEVPEPATAMLLLSGFAGLLTMRRSRKRRA
ncbi:PEP-CTERM sorting domain-containing protein [Massilia niabensis]|uniref:PEP-CTERM sorting domain-containing protein n=1 Tax=Massilia niabensis TaxID=544910 RepID=A0ABW0LD73_9BURK